MQLTNAWLGYDLPYDAVESHPAVKSIRAQGITKRIALKEHHVTVGYFPSVDSDALGILLATTESQQGPLTSTTLTFDGYGVIAGAQGKYVYFSPSSETGKEARLLREALSDSPLFDPTRNCNDLHLSIGGADPFTPSKPKQATLPESLTLPGSLILVGNVGGAFRRFRWDSAARTFVEMAVAGEAPKAAPAPAPPPTPAPVARPIANAANSRPLPVQRIAIFPKIQPDTAGAVFLLKKYGGDAFPGIENAEIIFMTSPETGKTPAQYEAEGTLLIDLAGSRFDHHTNSHEAKTECASTLIAKYLGIQDNPELKKLLAYTKRDDLEGKGTISSDPLDRAFGLSGIIMSLNRVYTDTPQPILDLVMAVYEAHVYEEYKRAVEMPAEWKELRAKGIAREIPFVSSVGQLLLVTLTSDNISLPGFIRAYRKADVVVQSLGSGNTNILTQQSKQLDLRRVVAGIRAAEAAAAGITLPADVPLDKPGRIDAIPEWYYDTAANTIQNGGVNPKGVPPTRLSLEQLAAIVQEGLR